jgi:hypothetical protein
MPANKNVHALRYFFEVLAAAGCKANPLLCILFH